MKRIFLPSIILFSYLFTYTLYAQESDYIKDYIERLENSRRYLVLVAETMPEENYNYKVSEESMSFAENLLHIGYAMDWHSQSLLGGRDKRDWQTDTRYKVGEKTKKEMMATIEQTFDETIMLLELFDPKNLEDELDYFGLVRTKRQIFMLLSDHITHHRGQMLVLMRLNGHVPPRYVLFQ